MARWSPRCAVDGGGTERATRGVDTALPPSAATLLQPPPVCYEDAPMTDGDGESSFQWTYLPNGRTMAVTSVCPDLLLLIETAVVQPGEGGDENIGGTPSCGEIDEVSGSSSTATRKANSFGRDETT